LIRKGGLEGRCRKKRTKIFLQEGQAPGRSFEPEKVERISVERGGKRFERGGGEKRVPGIGKRLGKREAGGALTKPHTATKEAEKKELLKPM